RLAGVSEPLSVGRFGLAKGKRVDYVTQAQSIGAFIGLREDYDRLTRAFALIELVDALVPMGQPLPETWGLLLDLLRHVETHPHPTAALVWAELKLLEVFGYLPQFGACAVCGAGAREAETTLSPEAGGVVCQAHAPTCGDRFRVTEETAIGLARTSALDQPPPQLKLADEALFALLPFWRHVAHAPLRANESLVGELRRSRPSPAG
ncbi:MAG: DNA repair protein RecO, partial [Fimbriimonas ginsengisoli]|nr:DNA repair protein RecO [Fimbriimonas ginsengisoli]